MESTEKTIILVQVKINATINKVWKCWTTPEDIMKWNNASDNWYTPKAENDLRIDGRFNYRMEAKDGSFGFDFGGIYKKVIKNKLIEYIIDDGRNVKIVFSKEDDTIIVVESFEAEKTNPIDMQRDGWQNILNNFKKYVTTQQI